jgi:hypothetical protein
VVERVRLSLKVSTLNLVNASVHISSEKLYLNSRGACDGGWNIFFLFLFCCFQFFCFFYFIKIDSVGTGYGMTRPYKWTYMDGHVICSSK